MSSHRHKSSRHSASGKHTSGGGGSSKRPKLQFDSDGYNITDGVSQIPTEFLEMQCGRLYIEFLRVSSEGMTVEQRNQAKNHAIFKVDFDESYDSYKPGQLLVKPVAYSGVSRSTARSIELQLMQGVPLSYLLGAIINPGVHHFWFTTRNDRYYGCRDFVTQALYQMCLSGLTGQEIIGTSPIDPGLPTADAFYALGMRFRVDPLGQGSACPIDRGNFEDYDRVETECTQYEGTQAADELAAYLAQ